ncbi:hypothetical protein POSPLADRAFT_1038037 [Postia placenta MAD-698-R-SB12]|uniref:Magnesium transporter n=1 Tax=Postia placenta MAD-698-R-SB12 TaxID=670580 RepID=A0A1X6NGH6_9APHY|nr:hypothetical protein POSPLADRAFT_1038037 [Postia placenta MAD-698-R-SB12]OSX67526.1 hypothetical protein POSPLADRAFT_1038037 [Postia placenta MAD-698-R-SB12]
MSTPTLTEKASARLKSMERKTRFSLPMQWPLCIRRTRRRLREGFAHFQVVFKHTSTISSTSTVHRMARTRRLVTSLARFLAHKSEVVAQLQKRLLTIGEWGLGRGTDHDHDVFIYMGDVQDHIITLQQSLAHYERVLSQAHPTYISRLRMSLSKAQSGTDGALVTLSTVSLGVLLVQTLIGLVSMNIHLPQNYLHGYKYNAFAVVIALSVMISLVYGFVVRMWWIQARQKRRLKYL